jgi:hypothetical protein
VLGEQENAEVGDARYIVVAKHVDDTADDGAAWLACLWDCEADDAGDLWFAFAAYPLSHQLKQFGNVQTERACEAL